MLLRPPARLTAASATTEAARNICVTRQVPKQLPLEFYDNPARLTAGAKCKKLELDDDGFLAPHPARNALGDVVRVLC